MPLMLASCKPPAKLDTHEAEARVEDYARSSKRGLFISSLLIVRRPQTNRARYELCQLPLCSAPLVFSVSLAVNFIVV